MSVILTYWGVQLLLVILALACIIWAAIWLFNQDIPKPLAVLPGILAAVFVWGFFWGQTHIVVPPNREVLVVDKRTGQTILPIRNAGVTQVPLWTSIRYGYPAQTYYQWCPTFTPSSKNGASLTVVVCFTIDASKVDWAQQFKAFNGDEGVVLGNWQNAIQKSVAIAFSQFDPRDLTNKRTEVETAIHNQTNPWFESQGILVTMVGFKNWQFSSEEINKAYDQAQLSQTQIDIANSEKEAANVQRDTALIRAGTQVQVATQLAEGQRKACILAGMTSEQSCLEYLRLVWLSSLPDNPNVVVVNGANNPPIAIQP